MAGETDAHREGFRETTARDGTDPEPRMPGPMPGPEPLPKRIVAAVTAAVALALRALEEVAPRRAPQQHGVRRIARNLALTATAAVVVRAVEAPVARALSARVAARRIGLLPRLGLPPRIDVAAGVLLLDYTLYLWHVATHRSAFLWRFHSVHHVDRELDVTTATRFHFGEILASVAFRAAQIVVIGVSPRALSIWQALLVPSILFHHSNVRLPRRLESVVGKVIVTPHMHTIHHSARADHLASNWSSGLVLWDWLHGTLKLDVDEASIDIGVPGDDEGSLGTLLARPFRSPDATQPQ